MTAAPLPPLRLIPAYKERVWGGQKLGGTAEKPIGEAWIIHEEQPVQDGEFAGRTLADLTREYPAQLVGAGWQGGRFPLLIKLLDCQDWLSVQVHPNDQQAAQMVGPGELGKTEAWHILQATPEAKLIAGTKPGVKQDELAQAIRAGNVAALTEERAVVPGDTLMVPAGTLHALGPGLLIYEVQQTSDTTYRVYDWDRPASAGRELHLEQSAQVARPGQAGFTPAQAPAQAAQGSDVQGSDIQVLAQCEYFVLEGLRNLQAAQQFLGDTAGHSFHILTVKTGEAQLSTSHGDLRLRPYDTVLLPASLGQYQLSGQFEVLRASLP